MKIDIVSTETGEVLATVTTRYNSLEALFANVRRWMSRHTGYRYVSSEELEAEGLSWSRDTYWVKEV